MKKLYFGTKKLGFGCMRLPLQEGENMQEGTVDQKEFSRMIDLFLSKGFCYFDTAHGYVGGKSETALRECLVKRYPRDKYLITDKLSNEFFRAESDIRPLFEQQLKAVGVSYFDYYLMHSLTDTYYKKFVSCNAFSVVKQLKEEGKICHIGISFHDKPEVLERILEEQPDIEVVQIQFNYVDYDNPMVQSRAVYEVCRKFQKPVIVMEPVKGGSLLKLPTEAKRIYDDLEGGSYASYAIRFAASQEGIAMVLSGMSSLEQMQDNLSYMQDFCPLKEKEYTAVQSVAAILKKEDVIPCTGCCYCVAGCPRHILIPNLFGCLNGRRVFQDANSGFYYGVNTSDGHGKASDCIRCRQCERSCPQHLPITDLLKTVAESFESKKE